MKNPAVAEGVGFINFSWPELGLRVMAERLTDQGSAELTFYSVNKSGESLLHTTRANLLATPTMNSLAKRLQKNSADIPWVDVLTYITGKTMEIVRRGEPAVDLTTSSEVKRPEYPLYPLIIKNYPNIIFGDPSAAKSTLAVILSQVLLLPWRDNPMGISAPSEPVKVLYLDWETDEDTILWQTTMLAKGMDLGLLTIKYRHCSTPIISDLEVIKRHIGNLGIDVIIIDSLGLAAGGELNDTKSALGFYAALRDLRITSLILAHNSKDRESKNRSIYGNQFFTAGARNVWEIRKRQEYDSNEMDVALFHRKPPPFGKLHKPLGFKIVFGEDTMQIEQRDPQTVSEFMEQMGAKQRILELLKEGPMTTGEIMERLEITRGNADTTLKRLKDRALVVKAGDKWGLKSDNEAI